VRSGTLNDAVARLRRAFGFAPGDAKAHENLACKTSSLKDAFCVTLLAAVALAIALPRWRSGLDLGDEGVLACGALRVMEGQIPHRDFFSLQPPLSFYTSALMFKLFGTSLASLRLLGVGLHLALPLLTYGISRRVMSPGMALMAAFPAAVMCMPFFGFVPFAVWQGITASLMAALLLVWAITPGKCRPVAAISSGVLTAISIFLRHDQGFYLAVSIAAYLWLLRYVRKEAVPAQIRERVFIFWISGAALVIVPLLAIWSCQGAFPDMVKQLLIFPMTTYWKTSSVPVPHFSARLLSAENAIVIVCLYLFPPVVTFVSAVRLARRIRRQSFDSEAALLAFFLIWSALYFCQVLTRSDLNHLLITLPPSLILAAWAWQAALAWLSAMRISVAAKTGMCVVVGAVAFSYLWPTREVFFPAFPNEQPVLLNRAGVRSEIAQRLTNFINKVQTQVPPSRSILCLPYQPMFYFLCERRNPTHWNYIWPGDQTAADYTAMIQQAKEDPPALVLVMEEENVTKYSRDILEYIHAEYQPAATNAGLVIYLPN
jgi:hypothetical protein